MSRTQATLHHFADGAEAAIGLAGELGIPASAIRVHRFPDGEALPTVEPPGRVALLYRPLDLPDGKLLPLALAADALRAAGAEHVCLVAPYLPYMRQDAVFAPGQPVSQRVVARILGAVFDRVVTVDAHLHRIRSLAALFSPCAVDNLASTPAVADWLRQSGARPDLIVGPDEESRPWVEALAGVTGSPWLTMRKIRLADASVVVSVDRPEDIANRRVLVVDDICSTGGTLRQAIAALGRAGASAVQAYVTHALFTEETAATLRSAGADLLISSDSIPHPTNAVKLRGVLAAALRDTVSSDGGR